MDPETVDISKLEETLAKLEDGLTVMKGRAERAERELLVAKLDEDDRAAFQTLSKADKASVIDRLQRGKGISKILDPVKLQIAKSNELPEPVRKQLAEEVTKREALEKRLTIAEAVAKKAVDEAELVTLSKRAEKDYPHLPCTSEEKGAVLKFVEGASKEVKEAISKMFKAGNEALSSLFIEKGSSASDPGGAEEKIDAIAKQLVAENVSKGDKQLTYAVAYAKTLEMHPELYNEYLREHKSQTGSAS